MDPGDLVLVYNKSLEDQWEKSSSNGWSGPYKIKEQLPKGLYLLEEMDSTELKTSFAASHIKRFFPCGRNLEDIRKEELDPEKVSQEKEEGEVEDTMDQSELIYLLDKRLKCSTSTEQITKKLPISQKN